MKIRSMNGCAVVVRHVVAVTPVGGEGARWSFGVYYVGADEALMFYFDTEGGANLIREKLLGDVEAYD